MELTAVKREKFGRAVKPLRKQGLIPAELYGHGIENMHLSVSDKDFRRIFKDAGETTLINLVVDGKKHPVMIHDVARHSITDDILNIDFHQVRMDEKIEIDVPLVFTGEAPAVKEKGGVLVKSVSELAVSALPSNVPHDIKVDLSKLAEVGASIHIKDIDIPKDVKVLADPQTVVATVIAKMTEEEEAKLAAEVDVAAVKTEMEEKTEEKSKEEAAPEAGAEQKTPSA